MAEHDQQSLLARFWELLKRAYAPPAPSLNAQLAAEFQELQQQLRPRNLPTVLWVCADNEVDEQIAKLHFYDSISGQPQVLSHTTLASMLTIRADLRPLVGPHGELTNTWYLRANAYLRAMLAEG
jgi:hypothetical protein